MILISPRMQQLLREPVFESFWCVELGQAYYTSFYTHLNANGKLYSANGGLVQVDPPKMDSVVDRQPFEITFSDVAFAHGQQIENGLVGTPVAVYLGLVDQNTRQPEVNDLILVYKGRVDGANYAVSTAVTGESALKIVCSSPMHDLDLVKACYASQDFSDKNYPGDTSYEQIFEGSGQINMRWGKSS